MILDNKKIKTIHMIGIGGISMSGLAEILLDMGYKITGSDLNYTEKLISLEKKGVIIFKGHHEKNIGSQDIIVHTAAVKNDNPEMIKAKSLGLLRIDRSILLGEIMLRHRKRIAVSGTHGKSTTAAMASLILLNAGLKPTIHVGAEFADINGTTYIGERDYFITEACEYTETYLRLKPTHSIITNIEFDHGDYFKDIDHLKSSFVKFINLLPDNGAAFINIDDECTKEIYSELSSVNINTFSLEDRNAYVYASEIEADEIGRLSYDCYVSGIRKGRISLSVPGRYNLYNSLAAVALASYFNISFNVIQKSLSEFKGLERRFDIKGERNGIRVIDDYAHHPSEIKSLLSIFNKNRKNTLWCVFQSHTYTRTKLLLDDFAVSFENADRIIITDIYAAREKDNNEVSGEILSDRIQKAGKNSIFLSGFENISKYLKANVKPGDIILTVGAGDVHRVGEMFLEIGS